MKQYLEKRGIYITWSQLVMRIIFDLVGFLLALLPAGLTLYLTDVWITSGTHMPTSWICGIIVCVFLIHSYQFYFVNYNSQMNADRMAGNYRQHLAQKILSSSIPAYESQNKARIQNMANDVSAIYTVSSYLVTVPANLVKVMIIIGLLLFYPVFYFVLNLPTHGSQPYFSNILPARRLESNLHNAILFGIRRAFPDLAFDGFFALIVAGIAGVDYSGHRRASLRSVWGWM